MGAAASRYVLSAFAALCAQVADLSVGARAAFAQTPYHGDWSGTMLILAKTQPVSASIGPDGQVAFSAGGAAFNAALSGSTLTLTYSGNPYRQVFTLRKVGDAQIEASGTCSAPAGSRPCSMSLRRTSGPGGNCIEFKKGAEGSVPCSQPTFTDRVQTIAGIAQAYQDIDTKHVDVAREVPIEVVAPSSTSDAREDSREQLRREYLRAVQNLSTEAPPCTACGLDDPWMLYEADSGMSEPTASAGDGPSENRLADPIQRLRDAIAETVAILEVWYGDYAGEAVDWMRDPLAKANDKLFEHMVCGDPPPGSDAALKCAVDKAEYRSMESEEEAREILETDVTDRRDDLLEETLDDAQGFISSGTGVSP